MIILTPTFLDIFYGINLFLSLGAIPVLLISARFASQKGLSKAISTYIRCTFIFMFGIPIISIFSSIYHFHFADENPLVLRVSRNAIAFFGYFFRFFQLMLCADRLHATFVLKRNPNFQTKEFGYILTGITVALSILWSLPWIISDHIFFFNAFVSVFLHMIVLFMIIALSHYNRRLHVFLAYKVDLKQRCQVVENIKTLKHLRPYLILSSTIAPLGPVTIALIYAMTETFAPIPVFYAFYNLTYLICGCLFLFNCWKTSWILRANKSQVSSISLQCTTVRNVLGKKIPADCNAEEYFYNLKKFWDSS